MKVKMYDYQEEVRNKNNTDTLICNWARWLGKTYTIVGLILEERPKNVLYFGYSKLSKVNVISDKISEIQTSQNSELATIKYITSLDKIILTYLSGDTTNIYNGYSDSLDNINNFDYIFFDGLLPFDLKGISSNKTISFITINNHSYNLEKLYNKNVTILNQDYNAGIRNGLFNSNIKNLQETQNWLWYEEYAILDKPIEYGKNDLYNYFPTDNPIKKFLIDSISEIQTEYNEIAKTKDTVLTRRNLLEMIFQLHKEINR